MPAYIAKEAAADIKVRAAGRQGQHAGAGWNPCVPVRIGSVASDSRQLRKIRSVQPANLLKISPHKNVRIADGDGSHNSVGVRGPERVEAAIPINARQILARQAAGEPKIAAHDHFAVRLPGQCVNPARRLHLRIKVPTAGARKQVEFGQRE